MKTEIMEKTAYQKAYERWFAGYEVERRRQRKRRGSSVVGFCDAPPNPGELAELVEIIGVRQVLSVLAIHRSTLARWLAGFCVVPRSSWLLLVLMAEGRLPGMSEDWRDWRFVGDRLHLVGTRTSFSARELAGWQYQVQHAEALSRRIVALERDRAYLLRTGDFEAANDALAV